KWYKKKRGKKGDRKGKKGDIKKGTGKKRDRLKKGDRLLFSQKVACPLFLSLLDPLKKHDNMRVSYY
ncbi:MAG: hypothetical protein KAU46_12060, partial [Candidatus Aminicenantes bacterium]|nr:hypothetical protein [Candidatus Aminicenantes bacterium]